MSTVKKIHVKLGTKEITNLLIEDSGCEIFGSYEELLNRSVLLTEDLLLDAKEHNDSYSKIALKNGNDEIAKIKMWTELSPFLRKSNIVVSRYEKIIRKLYNQGKTIDELAKLEHIRWCRYYYLENWKYADVEKKMLRINIIPILFLMSY